AVSDGEKERVDVSKVRLQWQKGSDLYDQSDVYFIKGVGILGYSVPTKTGYTFGGYYKENGLTNQIIGTTKAFVSNTDYTTAA
ncbi:hypothetical protein ACKI1O_52410, partial [Streptomyces scabiei]